MEKKAFLKVAVGCTVALALNHQVALAEKWIIGLGGNDVLDKTRDEALAGLIEFHSNPFWSASWGEFSWLGTLQVDSSDSVFLGAGVNVFSRLGESNLFLEGSIGAGPMWQSNVLREPANDFLFRTSIGFGFILKNGHRLSISLDHLLDSDFQNHNPGTESIMVRYAFSF